MSILFDATRTVKPAPARRFGKGLLAARPTYRADFTTADEAWLVEDNARRAREDATFDRAYAESVALDRLERGLCC